MKKMKDAFGKKERISVMPPSLILNNPIITRGKFINNNNVALSQKIDIIGIIPLCVPSFPQNPTAIYNIIIMSTETTNTIEELRVAAKIYEKIPNTIPIR